MLTENLKTLLDAMGAGWVLALLLVLSVVSVGIIVERVVFFTRNRVDLGAAQDGLRRALEHGGLKEGLEEIRKFKGMEAYVTSEILAQMDRGAAAVEEVAAGAVARERIRYERYLSFLGTLGNNAPFIGLFGTVVGIMGAFGDLERQVGGQTASRASAIMGSISEALVATAIGLFVAIPAVIAYNQFKGLIKRAEGNTDALVRVVLSFLKTHPDHAIFAGKNAASHGKGG